MRGYYRLRGLTFFFLNDCRYPKFSRVVKTRGSMDIHISIFIHSCDILCIIKFVLHESVS